MNGNGELNTTGRAKEVLIEILGARSRPWSWAVPGAALLLAGIGVLLVTLGQSFTTGWDWLKVIAGVLSGIASGLLQLGIQKADRTLDAWGKEEANRLRIAVKDALKPLAEIIAQMPAKTPAKRQAELAAAANHAVGALNLLLKNVDRLRAVVYAIDDPNPGESERVSMSAMAYQGRGTKPHPFVAGTERGDSALALVREAQDIFVPDLDGDVPAGYAGSGRDYRTFISASISTQHAGGAGYGMVTVDARGGPHRHRSADRHPGG